MSSTSSSRFFSRSLSGGLALSLLTVLGLTAAVMPGCGKFGPGGPGGQGAPEEEPEDKPSPVVVAEVGRGTIEGEIRASSSIEAELQVTVHAEATGRLTFLGFEEGDHVDGSTVLAKVKRDAQSLGVERATSSVADAQREFERVEKLYNQGIASQSEYDQSKSTLDNARLDAKDRRRDLSNTTVRAPFTGTVTQRFVSPGSFVTSGAQIYELTDFRTLVARVYVPEKELDRIAIGQDASVVGKAAKGRSAVGEVRRIAPTVDSATGTVKVTIGLPAPESEASAQEGAARKGFMPGMYAEVTLTTEVHENVLIVPKPALIHDEEQVFVFVVAQGEPPEAGEAGDDKDADDADKSTQPGLVAKKTLIEVGLSDDDYVEAVGGIEQGARIIVAGQTGLKDGAKIVEVDGKGQPLDGADEDKGEAEEAAAKVAEVGG